MVETDGRASRTLKGQYERDVPLVAITRGADIGSVHRGSLAVRDTEGRSLLTVGDPSEHSYLRSAAKPFQALPAILSGAVDRFDISEEEVALLCASHNAEKRHVELLQSVLDKIGVSPDALQCGVHPPMHAGTAAERIAAGIAPDVLCHNCSGSHAGMLAACRASGWPIETYTAVDHPLQHMIRSLLAEFGGIRVDHVRVAVDNCNVPTFAPPLHAVAVACARLASGLGVRDDLAAAALRISAAMADYPYVVAGEGRFDTELMEAGAGNLIAKGGAEGYEIVGIRDTGVGLAMKISDGAVRAVAPATIRALESLGFLTEAQSDQLSRLRDVVTLGQAGDTLGRAEPMFG